MTVRALSQMGRMPEAGRIRLGVKSGRAMKSIDTFRLTSPDEQLIHQAAERFGAKEGPRAWDDPKANPRRQFEVITKADRLRVFLPPNALSCTYELWSGGGCERRCDGEVCEVPQRHGDELRIEQLPCMCVASNNMQCRPTSRLNVLLPDLKFAGVWRMETHGWNALQELMGMEHAIAMLQEQVGMVEAELSLQQRQSDGGRKKFVVPVLGITSSAEELMAGMADVRSRSLGAVQSAAVAELNAAPDPEPVVENDEVVEAEIVDDTVVAEVNDQIVDDGFGALRIEFSDLAHAARIKPDDLERGFVRWVSRSKHDRLVDLSEKQVSYITDAVARVKSGEVRFRGLTDGVATLEEA